jgi:hypothetical protein
MRKRTKFLVVAIVALTALAVGLTTTVLAQDSSSDQNGDNSPQQTFTSKVASILGLEEEQVANAFNQACQEMRDEALEQRLQKAVENGCLTEEEADQILQWWQDRPETLENLSPLVGCLQIGNRWRHQQLQSAGRGRCVAQIFDERLNGTIASISEETKTITLTTEEGNEVTFEYTSNTTFVLRGVTTVEAGQTATAWCWEDNEGNLTAKIVRIELP